MIKIQVDVMVVILSLYSIILITMEFLMKIITHTQDLKIDVEKEVFLVLDNI